MFAINNTLNKDNNINIDMNNNYNLLFSLDELLSDETTAEFDERMQIYNKIQQLLDENKSMINSIHIILENSKHTEVIDITKYKICMSTILKKYDTIFKLFKQHEISFSKDKEYSTLIHNLTKYHYILDLIYCAIYCLKYSNIQHFKHKMGNDTPEIINCDNDVFLKKIITYQNLYLYYSTFIIQKIQEQKMTNNIIELDDRNKQLIKDISSDIYIFYSKFLSINLKY